MSFLRNIRNNLTNHGSDRSKTRTASPSKPAKPARSSLASSTLNRNGDSDYGTTASRRNSGVATNGNRRSSTSASTLQRREDKYGKENPAPIIVYVDKYETVKKPAGILRNNTFTKGDREQGRRQSAITRSDTFTIPESEDEKQKERTSTYTRKKKEKSQENLYESRDNDNNEDPEKLPVVFDSSTYRKKSLKSSKPVQKVDSFFKRVEKSLFKHDSKKNGGRKNSNSSETSYVPKFRDVGINCKLDDEERMKTTRKKRGSRDSLLDTTNLEHSSSSQRSYRERSTTPLVKARERSASPTKRYATYDRKETRFERDSSPVPPEKPKRVHERDRSISPFETLELKSKAADNSYLKARQKEIEMGYSQVNKKPSLTSTPDRNKSILVNTTRSERYDPERGRNYTTVTTTTHRVEFDRPSGAPFRADTYNTLREEYEQANRKPVGIASPRLNSDRPKQQERSTSPVKPARKDSTELPKYTFGTNLQERRSRFQEFQKSFKKMDGDEVQVQQSFFVPI